MPTPIGAVNPTSSVPARTDILSFAQGSHQSAAYTFNGPNQVWTLPWIFTNTNTPSVIRVIGNHDVTPVSGTLRVVSDDTISSANLVNGLVPVGSESDESVAFGIVNGQVVFTSNPTVFTHTVRVVAKIIL